MTGRRFRCRILGRLGKQVPQLLILLILEENFGLTKKWTCRVFPNRAPWGCIRFGDLGDVKWGPNRKTLMLICKTDFEQENQPFADWPATSSSWSFAIMKNATTNVGSGRILILTILRLYSQLLLYRTGLGLRFRVRYIRNPVHIRIPDCTKHTVSCFCGTEIFGPVCANSGIAESGIRAIDCFGRSYHNFHTLQKVFQKMKNRQSFWISKHFLTHRRQALNIISGISSDKTSRPFLIPWINFENLYLYCRSCWYELSLDMGLEFSQNLPK